MTTVYFMRHAESLKYNNINTNDSLQIQNEKWPLTINGENMAKEKSLKEEFSNFDIVISSNYVRTISTAKYFTRDKINVDEAFGERKFGVNAWSEIPPKFEEQQFEDFDYKLENGESLNEVAYREKNSLKIILSEYKNKKILIVGHSTALAALFSNWCEVNYTGSYKFKDNIFFDGKWNNCETFKLSFDENNDLINIENLK